MNLQIGILLAAVLLIVSLPAAASTAKKTTTSKKTSSHTAAAKKASSHKTTSTAHRSKKSKHGKKYASRKSWKSRGQKAISSDRTRQIQEALIREHYLDGEPTGQWDSRTQTAMRRFQAEQGWQTKVLPDSRALIKLGLGPDHSDVLNPETAATSPYQPGGGMKSSVTNSIAPATSAVIRDQQ